MFHKYRHSQWTEPTDGHHSQTVCKLSAGSFRTWTPFASHIGFQACSWKPGCMPCCMNSYSGSCNLFLCYLAPLTLDARNSCIEKQDNPELLQNPLGLAVTLLSEWLKVSESTSNLEILGEPDKKMFHTDRDSQRTGTADGHHSQTVSKLRAEYFQTGLNLPYIPLQTRSWKTDCISCCKNSNSSTKLTCGLTFERARTSDIEKRDRPENLWNSDRKSVV